MANWKSPLSISVYIGTGVAVLYWFYLGTKDTLTGGGSAVTKKINRRHKRNKQTKVKSKM